MAKGSITALGGHIIVKPTKKRAKPQIGGIQEMNPMTDAAQPSIGGTIKDDDPTEGDVVAVSEPGEDMDQSPQCPKVGQVKPGDHVHWSQPWQASPVTVGGGKYLAVKHRHVIAKTSKR